MFQKTGQYVLDKLRKELEMKLTEAATKTVTKASRKTFPPNTVLQNASKFVSKQANITTQGLSNINPTITENLKKSLQAGKLRYQIKKDNAEIKELKEKLAKAVAQRNKKVKTLTEVLESHDLTTGSVNKAFAYATTNTLFLKNKVMDLKPLTEIKSITKSTLTASKVALKVGVSLGIAQGILDVASYTYYLQVGQHLPGINILRTAKKLNSLAEDAKKTQNSATKFDAKELSNNIYNTLSKTFNKYKDTLTAKALEAKEKAEKTMNVEDPKFTNLEGLNSLLTLYACMDVIFGKASPEIKKNIAIPIEMTLQVLNTIPSMIISEHPTIIRDITYLVAKGFIDIIETVRTETEKYPDKQISEKRQEALIKQTTDNITNKISDIVVEAQKEKSLQQVPNQIGHKAKKEISRG